MSLLTALYLSAKRMYVADALQLR